MLCECLFCWVVFFWLHMNIALLLIIDWRFSSKSWSWSLTSTISSLWSNYYAIIHSSLHSFHGFFVHQIKIKAIVFQIINKISYRSAEYLRLISSDHYQKSSGINECWAWWPGPLIRPDLNPNPNPMQPTRLLRVSSSRFRISVWSLGEVFLCAI